MANGCTNQLSVRVFKHSDNSCNIVQVYKTVSHLGGEIRTHIKRSKAFVLPLTTPHLQYIIIEYNY